MEEVYTIDVEKLRCMLRLRIGGSKAVEWKRRREV